MDINAEMVKNLRQETGCGFMEGKKALEEAKGDTVLATELLRKRGLKTAALKSGRAANEGLVYAYIHHGSKVGVLVEVNCETDFVARTAEFQQLVKDISMHIAAANPRYLRREDIPEELVKKEEEIYRTQLKDAGKPDNVIDKIIPGKLEKGFYAQQCLLEQPYIKDDTVTVGTMIQSAIGKLKENICVRRFTRYQLSA